MLFSKTEEKYWSIFKKKQGKKYYGDILTVPNKL